MSSPYPGDPYPAYQEPSYQEPAYRESAYPPPYPPPPYQQPWGGSYVVQPVIVANPQTSGKAIASMVLGICFVVTVCSFAIFLPVAVLTGLGTGIPAVILGHMALKQIAQSGGQQSGREMAITGLVLGYISIGAALICGLLSIFFFLFFLQVFSHPYTQPYPQPDEILPIFRLPG